MAINIHNICKGHFGSRGGKHLKASRGGKRLKTSKNVFCCLLCIFYCQTTPILKTLGQFEKIGVCNHVN